MPVIYRERIPSRDPRLGRHIHHDSRSQLHLFQPRRASRTITSVQHTKHKKVLSQGQLGSCVGNDAIGRLATGKYFATITPADHYHNLDQPEAVDLYSRCTREDPFPGAYIPGDPDSEDTGSDGLTAAKILTRDGIISGYTHTFTSAELLQALMEYPVGFGTYWFSDMFHPNAEGLVKPTGSVAGGHQFCMDGYDAVRGWFWSTNSWGADWGVEGRFAMEGETVEYLIDRQADMIVYVPATEDPPAPEPGEPADDADAEFAPILKPWASRCHIGGNATVATAARAWLRAKGL